MCTDVLELVHIVESDGGLDIFLNIAKFVLLPFVDNSVKVLNYIIEILRLEQFGIDQERGVFRLLLLALRRIIGLRLMAGLARSGHDVDILLDNVLAFSVLRNVHGLGPITFHFN